MPSIREVDLRPVLIPPRWSPARWRLDEALLLLLVIALLQLYSDPACNDNAEATFLEVKLAYELPCAFWNTVVSARLASSSEYSPSAGLWVTGLPGATSKTLNSLSCLRTSICSIEFAFRISYITFYCDANINPSTLVNSIKGNLLRSKAKIIGWSSDGKPCIRS